VSSNPLELANRSHSIDARMASQADLADEGQVDESEEPDVGVMHAPKGWKDVPRVWAIMVRFWLSSRQHSPN
jgi:hypothetical protein